jgi:hypothetical protein
LFILGSKSGIRQVEQVYLNLKQKIPGMIRESEEQRVKIADVFIPNGN